MMTFYEICKKTFAGLIHSYELHCYQKKENLIYLKNKTVGLEVIWDLQDHAIFVNVYQLENGEFPGYDDLKSYDNRRNGLDFLSVLKHTCPQKMFSPFIDGSSNSIETVLSNYSKSICTCFPGLLRGNFADYFKSVNKDSNKSQ